MSIFNKGILLTAVFCAFVSGCVTTQEVPKDDKSLAFFLLNKMHDTYNSIVNYKCDVSYLEGRPKEFWNEPFESPTSHPYAYEDAQRYRLCKDKIALNYDGFGRIQAFQGTSNYMGREVKNEYERIATWNGEKAVEYSKDYHSKFQTSVYYSALISDSNPFTSKRTYRLPWELFCKSFCAVFKEAIQEGVDVRIDRNDDGTFRISIPDAVGISCLKDSRGNEYLRGALYVDERIATVDPSKGYNVVMEEEYQRGELFSRTDIKYRRFGAGIWFPVNVEHRWFWYPRFSENREAHTHLAARISNIKINDENFCDGLYDIDFPVGTMVLDALTGQEYCVGEPAGQ